MVRRKYSLSFFFLLMCTSALWAQWPPVIDLAQEEGDLQIWGTNAGDVPWKSGDRLGWGDINGDGLDDLIIGAPLTDDGGSIDVGRVYVLYGADSLPSHIDFQSPVSGTVVITGVEAGDEIGTAVCSGDVNGDGFDDVVIGAPEAKARAGKVYIAYGPDLARVVILSGSHEGDLVGQSVATGDVNADGFEDVLIGAPGAVPEAKINGGMVYILLGREEKIASGVLEGGWLGVTEIRGIDVEGQGGDNENEALGWAVASGDLDGDGMDEVVMGAPHTFAAGYTHSGVVYAVYGRPDLSPVIDLERETYGVKVLGYLKEWLGSPLATGDINGDGLDEIALAAPKADLQYERHDSKRLEEGRVSLVFGQKRRFLMSERIELRNYPSIWGNGHLFARWSVAAGDMDGDGFDDILIGNPWSSPFSRSHAGTVYLIYGATTLPDTIYAEEALFNGARATRIFGREEDYLGYSIATGDINGDGIYDLGVVVASAGQKSVGKVVVIFGRRSSTTMDERSDNNRTFPKAYRLEPNFPNPFNSLTRIGYDLPRASDVTVTIYTLTGQKIAVLVDARQEAGHHTVLFDGSPLGTGVYLSRLHVEGFAETRRMVLLK